MNATNPAHHLTRQRFEEELLRGPVIRINLEVAEGGNYDQPAIEAIITAALHEDPVLVSCRVPIAAEPYIRTLEARGFRRVETLVTLERTLDSSHRKIEGVELADAGDEEACVEIARTAFSSDRFHADPQISDLAADQLKSAWALNSLRGRADACFVIRHGGETVGFNFCLVASDYAIIDLIAVSVKHQGRGFGKKLVEGSLAYYAGRKPLMRVGTQSVNVASIRIYENADFHLVNRQATLHLLPHGRAPV